MAKITTKFPVLWAAPLLLLVLLTTRAPAQNPTFRALNSSAFSPSSVAGLLMWFKADAITGKTDGNAVSQWDDSSGGARHMTQATGSLQPLYKTGIVNSLPVVRFDGTDDYLSAASVAITSDLTIFVVSKSAAGSYPQSSVDSDSSPRLLQYRYGSAGTFDFITFKAAGGLTTDSQAVTAGSFSIICGRRDSSAVQVWVNNATDGSSATTAGQVGTVTIWLGSRIGGGQFLNGDIAEVLVYTSALSTADRQSVQTYLAAKYGITLS